MNPGYIGRAELPESLKALFRPITVVVPDRQLIMENMLMAEVRALVAVVGGRPQGRQAWYRCTCCVLLKAVTIPLPRAVCCAGLCGGQDAGEEVC